jgi:hypothetical protein
MTADKMLREGVTSRFKQQQFDEQMTMVTSDMVRGVCVCYVEV